MKNGHTFNDKLQLIILKIFVKTLVHILTKIKNIDWKKSKKISEILNFSYMGFLRKYSKFCRSILLKITFFEDVFLKKVKDKALRFLVVKNMGNDFSFIKF